MTIFKKIIISILLFGNIFVNASSNDFNFAWFSDTHIGVDGATNDLEAVVKDVNLLTNIDFVIVSGDISEMDIENNLDSAKLILDNLNVRYHVIPGNHDTKWSSSGCTKFTKIFGKNHFNFVHHGIRFIGIDQGPIMRMAPGFFPPGDLRWIALVLKNIKKKSQPIIIVTHYPIDESVSNYSEFLEIIKDYNIQFILHGHGHANKVFNFDGIPGVMNRSTLSGKEKYGGYNIVKIQDDSATFYQKKINEKKVKWHSLPLGKKDWNKTIKFPKQDFAIIKDNPNVEIKWIYDSGFLIASKVCVEDDKIIFGNRAGYVTAISLTTGKPIWKLKTKTGIFTTPEVYRNKVIISSTDSYIYCLNIKEGNVIWKYKTDAPIVASPVVFKNTIYIGGSDYKFRAIDLSTGKLKWEYNGVKGFIENTPLIYKDKIIFTAWDETVYALNILNGKLCWKWSHGFKGKLFSPAVCNPVGAYNKIFIVAPDRFTTAIDVETGKTIWRTNSFTGRESIALSEKSRMIYIKTMQDTLVAISTISKEPKIKWKSAINYGYDINPSYAVEKHSIIYFTTQEGYIYSVDANIGELIWKEKLSVGLLNTPVVTDSNEIILSGFDGKIICLKIKK